jgi:transcriptional repressor NrdR
MKCPSCQAEDTKVIDSRLLNEGMSVRRRRKCDFCSYRFTTYEHLDVPFPVVLKRDGRREDYRREKVIKGIEKSLQKRPVSREVIDNLLEELETRLQQSGTKEIHSEEIGAMVMDRLREIDPVGFVRYASFYWDYNDIEGFLQGLRKSLPTKSKENSSGESNEIRS